MELASSTDIPILTTPLYGSQLFGSVGYVDPMWGPLLAPYLDTLGGLPPLLPSIWTGNVTTHVVMVLASIDEFLSWHTQFTSFVIMHQLYDMLDGFVSPPPAHVPMVHGSP